MESGETLPDPYSLRNDWIEDVDALPEVSWEDVTHYLIEPPSVYTKGKLKAYKSLEAYDYFVCGHVQMCYYHPIKKYISFCFVKSQVLPSQRQSDSSNMYNVWVCIHKKHGWILTANCSCMAGLGSACSHVAALLFKIEKAIHVRERDDTSPTSILCQWKSTKKSVETAPTQLINFSRVKKDDLPFVPSLTCSYVKNFSSNNPMAEEIPLTEKELKDLYTINPEAVFSLQLTRQTF